MSRTSGQPVFAFISTRKNSKKESGFIRSCRFLVIWSASRFIPKASLTFWRVLALVAVFHFVRQQYGWVALYRAKLKEKSRITWWIDAAAVYLATVYPLAFWMTSLPRNFEWFVQNDFFSLPTLVETILFPLYVLALVVYFGKSIYLYFNRRLFEYRQRYCRRDDRRLLVCRYRLFQFRLCFYGDERDHSRRSVFCVDLFLRAIAARKCGRVFIKRFQATGLFFWRRSGLWLMSRNFLASRRLARKELAVRRGLGLGIFENVSRAAACRAAIDALCS